MKGQAFLSLVLLIGTMILLIAVTIAVVVGTLVDTSYGYRASLQAEAVATSGAQDALLQLSRGAFLTNTTYTLPVGSSTANISVSLNTPSAGYDTILSSSTISNRTQKIDIVASVNASTTQVSVISWQEVQ